MMTEFSTRLNRSRRFIRSFQFWGMTLTVLFMIGPLVYMFYLTKAFAQSGSWQLILMFTPWVPLFYFIMLQLSLPILERPFVRVRITQEGVCVIRPLRKEQMIPWGAFQEVCIIDDDIALGSQLPPASLLLVKWEAPRKPNGRWDVSSATKADRLISIDFDAEVRAAIRILCPLKIADRRAHPSGKHSPIA